MYFSYKDWYPAYCLVEPHLDATLRTMATLPLNWLRAVSLPSMSLAVKPQRPSVAAAIVLVLAPGRLPPPPLPFASARPLLLAAPRAPEPTVDRGRPATRGAVAIAARVVLQCLKARQESDVIALIQSPREFC